VMQKGRIFEVSTAVGSECRTIQRFIHIYPYAKAVVEGQPLFVCVSKVYHFITKIAFSQIGEKVESMEDS
jgi:hypothetical protein